uniref:L-fucose kinase n=1 Tax=Branchiostoma floridae TaxID=7739 RepID=C3YGC4_BRAFL|eukprot:XP_002604634.1 hypothetical protein BRAFLDRAFT_92868 [Branchiostoma floridae]
MKRSWTAIVLTCQNIDSAHAYQDELTLRQRKGLIPADTLLLTVEDPKAHVGSGGATLNALLIVAEHLSARSHFTVVNSDVLSDADVLIMHIDGCTVEDGSVVVNSVLEGGVRVSSGSAVSHCHLKGPICIPEGCYLHALGEEVSQGRNFPYNPCGKAFTTLPATLTADTAVGYDGLFCNLDSLLDTMTRKGTVEDIVYKPSNVGMQELVTAEGNVHLVAGVVFLSSSAAERLLTVHVTPPLDACTYLGLDSGAEPIKLSLFFDILLCMATLVTEEAFVSGDRSGQYGGTPRPRNEREVMTMRNARALLWKTLRGINDGCTVEDGSVVVNSVLEGGVRVSSGSAVSHCHLKGPICIPEGCYLHALGEEVSQPQFTLSLELRMDYRPLLEKTTPFAMNPGMCSSREQEFYMEICGVHTWWRGSWRVSLQEVLSCVDHSAEFKWRRDLFYSVGQHHVRKVLLSGRGGCLLPFFKSAAVEGYHRQVLGTLDQVVTRTATPGVTARTLACIADVLGSLVGGQWGLRSGPAANKKWQPAYQLLEAGEYAAGVQALAQEREFWLDSSRPDLLIRAARHYEGAEQILRRQIVMTAKQFIHTQQSPVPSVGQWVVAECPARIDLSGGWSDTPPITYEHGGSVTNVALLIDGKKPIGAKARRIQDSRPDLLIRAARHYEGAEQILRRQIVMTAKQFIHTQQSPVPSVGQWVVAECPARIDLSGGWSDTPPITYEHGGSVTNVALLIDGKKPIGAKARRIQEPELVLVIDSNLDNSSVRLTCTELSDMETYCQPHAPGALLKACVMCADLVTLPSPTSLREQLQTRHGGGFELHTWSDIPHGSGLGTSSILAGAILAVLYKVTGREADNLSLMHGVLYVEQLLTSGGGWQDQVGGLDPAVKIGRCRPQIPVKVEVEHISVSDEVLQALNSRLVLVYTGKTRLARNLLQDVVRNWYARLPEVVANCDDLVTNAEDCAKAFREGDLGALGACMDRYWEQKKKMAPGCEPVAVRKMMTALKPHVYGQVLAGAGGGGFMCVLTRDPGGLQIVRNILQTAGCRLVDSIECIIAASLDDAPYAQHGACIICKAQEGSAATVSNTSSLSCPLPDQKAVTIRGYPLSVLSARHLQVVDHEKLRGLSIIDGELRDVENNTLSEFPYLNRLGLDFNRLAHVKRDWFTGLNTLSILTLSNNRIAQLEPGCFRDQKFLFVLNLEYNLLHFVDPVWFRGPYTIQKMYLGNNEIEIIPSGAFKGTPISQLFMQRIALTCLDWEVSRGLEDLSIFSVGGNRLISVHDEMSRTMAWSLTVYNDAFPRKQIVSGMVSNFHFCVTNDLGESLKSLTWMFDSAVDVSRSKVPRLCLSLGGSLGNVTHQPPFVVIATNDSLPKLTAHYPDKCRQVWEHDLGISVAMKGNSAVQLVSMGVENTTVTTVAIKVMNTQETKTSDSVILNTRTHTTHTRNMTCILLSKHSPSPLFFNIPKKLNKSHFLRKTDTDQESSLTPAAAPSTQSRSQTTNYYRSSTSTDQSVVSLTSTIKVSTPQTSPELVTSPPVPPALTIPLVVSILAGLLFLSLLFLLGIRHLLKSRCLRDNIDPADAHVWILPGLSLPGLIRSASLPVITHTAREVQGDTLSCKSLPAVVSSIQSIYDDIPDHLAAARRPLPALPDTLEIPVNPISGEVMSDSGHNEYDESDDYALTHTEGQSFAEASLVYNHQLSAGRLLAASESMPRSSYYCATIFRSTDIGWPLTTAIQGARRRASLPVLTYTYWSCETPGEQSPQTVFQQPLSTFPNTYWPWGILGYREGTRNIPSRESLTVTPPDTYWPWVIPGEGTRSTRRRGSLPNLPNTYWPWEIPDYREGTSNIPSRESLPLTPPDTYWPWVIPGEGARSTRRRGSLSTLPNTYWPWDIDIPGDASSRILPYPP